ncbi:30S ribosomal protein S9 [Candidatus Woesearchaeota archaeon]|nr:30S ribosomal protein S9 [Candidatus Woesearchaeota archaeon]
MKIIHKSGKRKTAIARATLKEGKGIVKINNIVLDEYKPKLSRLKLREPLLLAGVTLSKVDISIDVMGGGINSQAEAARLAAARALVAYDKKLEKAFLNYDRNFLVADVRRKETHKPNCRGKARAKKQKSYR